MSDFVLFLFGFAITGAGWLAGLWIGFRLIERDQRKKLGYRKKT